MERDEVKQSGRLAATWYPDTLRLLAGAEGLAPQSEAALRKYGRRLARRGVFIVTLKSGKLRASGRFEDHPRIPGTELLAVLAREHHCDGK